MRNIFGPDNVEPASLRAKRLTRGPDEDEFTVVFNASGHDISISVPGDTPDEAAEVFKAWLDHSDEIADGEDWRTVDARFDGQDVLFIFRAAWVAGFTVIKRVTR